MSLQFPSRSGYFSVALVSLLAACGERDRLTFPVEDPGSGSGPFTTITRPEVADTIVLAGEPFILSGFSTDPDGVNVVDFSVAGAGVSFAPLNGDGADTVRFSIALPTAGLSGDTIHVQVSAVDQIGDRGTVSVRQIRVQ